MRLCMSLQRRIVLVILRTTVTLKNLDQFTLPTLLQMPVQVSFHKKLNMASLAFKLGFMLDSSNVLECLQSTAEDHPAVFASACKMGFLVVFQVMLFDERRVTLSTLKPSLSYVVEHLVLGQGSLQMKFGVANVALVDSFSFEFVIKLPLGTFAPPVAVFSFF